MSSNKKSSSSGTSSSSSSAKKSSASPAVKPYKPNYHEMLSYGHKIGDNDYAEQREALGKAFTKVDQQAARDAQRAASSGRK